MGNEKYVMLVNDINKDDSYEIELLCSFEFEDNKYIIYSINELDFEGNNIIYPAKVINKEGKQYISELTNDEYEKIKNIIRMMINYGKEDTDVR